MKYILSIILVLLAFNAFSQCEIVTCTRTTVLVNGSTSNGNFATPGVPNPRNCFRGYGYVGTGATFSPTWGWLYFRDTVTCQKALVMPFGRKILTKDSIRLYSVTMVGGDSIINYGGFLQIDTLISSGSTAGQYNILMLPYTNSTINYRGTIYQPGDTISLTSNLDSNVLVMSCNNVPLAIDYIDLKRQGNELVWEYDDATYLWYSTDAKFYSLLPGTYFAGKSHYTIDQGGYYKVKSFNKESKVLKVVYNSEERQKEIIYFYNSQFTKERPAGVPVVGSKTIR